MKAILFVALIALAAATGTIGSFDLINEINNSQDLWTAGQNQFTGMHDDEIRKFYLGTMLNNNEGVPVVEHKELLELLTVPDAFDSRTQWPKCVHPIRNQAQCGSCWAFGASEALSDRFCIGSSGSVNTVLSPQDMVSCDTNDYGCQGGYLNMAWEYMEKTGIVTDECYPYTSAGGSSGSCQSACTGTGKFTKYTANSAGSFTKPAAIKAEIMTNGPIETGFTVYQDFMSYTGGIYKHTTGEQLGGHAVKIIGWGVESGTNFWIVANSWDVTWGEKGFFRIAEGQCGLDSQGIAGTANLSSV